jgi:hypothetical protein
MIGLWQFFFRVLAAEPDVCGRCGGAIAVGDVVVQVRDAGPGRLWHRSCVFVGDGDVSAFRNARRRNGHPRAIAASPGQTSLFAATPEAVRPELPGKLEQRQGQGRGTDSHGGAIEPVRGEDDRRDPKDNLQRHQQRGCPRAHVSSVAQGAIDGPGSDRPSTTETATKSRRAGDRPDALSAPLGLHVAVDAEPDEQGAQGDEAVATEGCVEELSDDADRETRCDVLGRRQGLQSHRHDRAGHDASVAHGRRG